MDVTHVIVVGLGAVAIAVSIVGFVLLARMLKKDEAIDAAIFLAQRQLDDYVKSGRAAADRRG